MLALASRIKRWRTFALSGLVLSAIGGVSCNDESATAIVVMVSTDSVVSAAVDTIEIKAVRGGVTKFSRSYRIATEAVLPGTLTLRDDGGMVDASTIRLEISGKVAATGQTRVSRRAQLAYVNGKTKLLRMPLRGDCLDVSCPTGQTCESSVCVPDDINVDTLPDAPSNPVDGIVFPSGAPLERSSAPADRASESAAISGDGRYVAFASIATNLVAGVSGGSSQIYVRDRQEKTTTLVSASDLGLSGSGDSSAPVISADGRYVAFVSSAPDLVADDSNGVPDVFVHDRLTGQTLMASVSVTGRAASGESRAPSLSSSGRFITFSSKANDLVLGDVNNAEDVFVRDMQTGVTVRVSIGGSGENAAGESSSPVISANGRYVAFASTASNVAGNDSNDASDVFVRDMQLGTTSMISVTSAGGSGAGASDQPAMSADGQIVAFRTTAPDLGSGAGAISQVIVVDRASKKIVTASGPGSGGDEASSLPAVSANGRRIAFVSLASNLVSGDSNNTSDVFLFDLDTSKVTRLSVLTSGAQSSGGCAQVALSANGEYAAFVSSADDLISGDGNGADDVFVVPLK